MSFFGRLYSILSGPPASPLKGEALGASREGRSVRGFALGKGKVRASLIGGAHADEPAGPRFLRLLAGYLQRLDSTDPLLARVSWMIVPHVNPDGEARNEPWCAGSPEAYDLAAYLAGAVREPPGDDMEFGFPSDPADAGARPENRAVFDWWRRTGPEPFHLHASLHGMSFAGGPWFLIAPLWKDRAAVLIKKCAGEATRLGYRLHDVERHGEKGFFRIARGFATHPHSSFMKSFFLDAGDEKTAALFRPSSMEAIASLGGDPLTLVTEMPLFITPGAGEAIGPPDAAAEEWKARIAAWRLELAAGAPPEKVRGEARAMGLQAMPARDQMALQWRMITAGLELLDPCSYSKS